MNESDSLKEILRTLELRLLQPGESAKDIGDLLAAEFVEFGSSGRVYDKRQVIESLQRGTAVHCCQPELLIMLLK